MNVGGGETATALDVTERLITISGVDVQPRLAQHDPPGEIPHQALDCSRLRGMGWSAKTSLQDGLALTWTVQRNVSGR